MSLTTLLSCIYLFDRVKTTLIRPFQGIGVRSARYQSLKLASLQQKPIYKFYWLFQSSTIKTTVYWLQPECVVNTRIPSWACKHAAEEQQNCPQHPRCPKQPTVTELHMYRVFLKSNKATPKSLAPVHFLESSFLRHTEHPFPSCHNCRAVTFDGFWSVLRTPYNTTVGDLPTYNYLSSRRGKQPLSIRRG